MVKSHQIKLYPTKAQGVLLAKCGGIARLSYNWALQKFDEMYEAGENPSAYKLVKLQNLIKKTEWPYFKEVSKTVPQYAIHNAYDSFKLFFKKLKDGTIDQQRNRYIQRRLSKGLPVMEDKLKAIGVPKFKKKNGVDSFVSVENSKSFNQSGFVIHIPRIGKIRCAENLRFEGKVNNVTVKRIADMWFAVINIEIPESSSTLKQSLGDNQAIVGVDFGIKSMMVLSDGTFIDNPRALMASLRKLKKSQRKLDKKVFGSNNSKKQKIKVGRIHYRISNIRKNAIHQATSRLIKNFDKIVIEDLSVSGMVLNKNLSKHLSDTSFGEIRRQLIYKANWSGKEVIVADKWFASSKICSCCGRKKDVLKLSERIYKCDNCGLEIDRDLNAAKNLANYGSTPKVGGSYAFGVGSSHLETNDSPTLNKELNLKIQ